MLSKQVAAHALSGSLSIALTELVGLGLLTGQAFEPYAPWGISPVVLLVVLTYVLGVRLVYLDQRISLQNESIEKHEAESPSAMTLRQALLGFAVCAVLIVIAGPYLAEAAGQIAELTGLGGTFIGTTLVAFCTPLP